MTPGQRLQTTLGTLLLNAAMLYFWISAVDALYERTKSFALALAFAVAMYRLWWGVVLARLMDWLEPDWRDRLPPKDRKDN